MLEFVIHPYSNLVTIMKTVTQKINKIKISFPHLPKSKTLKDYIQKKLSRNLNQGDDIQSIAFNLSKNSPKGTHKYSITLEVHMRNFGFAVKCQGNNLYKLINQAADKFHFRIIKFLERQNDHQNLTHEDLYNEGISLNLKKEAEQIERINFYANFLPKNFNLAGR